MIVVFLGTVGKKKDMRITITCQSLQSLSTSIPSILTFQLQDTRLQDVSAKVLWSYTQEVIGPFPLHLELDIPDPKTLCSLNGETSFTPTISIKIREGEELTHINNTCIATSMKTLLGEEVQVCPIIAIRR